MASGLSAHKWLCRRLNGSRPLRERGVFRCLQELHRLAWSLWQLYERVRTRKIEDAA